MQYEGRTCSKLGPLSERQRDRLPDKAFGIPAERKYPMPDPDHAANAKGRAKTAKQRGEITATQYDAIVRKADRVIARCNGPETKGLGDDWNRPRRGSRASESGLGIPIAMLILGTAAFALAMWGRNR